MVCSAWVHGGYTNGIHFTLTCSHTNRARTIISDDGFSSATFHIDFACLALPFSYFFILHNSFCINLQDHFVEKSSFVVHEWMPVSHSSQRALAERGASHSMPQIVHYATINGPTVCWFCRQCGFTVMRFHYIFHFENLFFAFHIIPCEWIENRVHYSPTITLHALFRSIAFLWLSHVCHSVDHAAWSVNTIRYR